jgi:phage-related protein
MMGKVGGMLSGAAEAVKDVADKAQIAAEKVVAAADQACSSVIPGKKQFDETSAGLSSAGTPVTEFKDKLKGGVSGDAESSIKALKEAADAFVKSITDAIDGDGKNLASGGACLKAKWISSIKDKLKKFKGEVDAIVAKAMEAPSKVNEELNVVSKQADIFTDRLEILAAMPKGAVGKVTSALMDPEKLMKIPDEVENEFKGLLATARKELDALTQVVTGVSSKLLNMVKAIVSEVDQFMPRTPKKLSAAFKAPMPICCLSPGGAKFDELTKGADSFAGAANMEPIVKAAEAMQKVLESLDLTVISSAFDESEGKMQEATKSVRDAAEKMNASVAGAGLRKLAGSAEGQPDAPGAAPAAPDAPAPNAQPS